MLMRMIYDDRLAQAAYLLGCQKTGEAIVIDPERDVDRYIAAAAKEGLRITAVAETHIHADFLSGTREMAERVNAKVYVSGEGGADWQYGWLGKRAGGGAYAHRVLRDGDVFMIGGIELRAVHTPGHTPEHMMYVVTDRGGGADEPMGAATGDFVFVGDLGRPDLLETAAGQAGAKEPAAQRLFQTLRKFTSMPEYVQVWPAHGAGSACGKALGAVPQTTVGYERRFNPAIRAAADGERAFVDFILAGQPEPPMYFARMKRENRDGPRVLGALPSPRRLSAAEIGALDGAGTAIIDTRAWKAFSAAHVRGSLFAPIDGMFQGVVGSYVEAEEPIVLIAEPGRIEETVRDLVRIGLDRIEAWAEPGDVERVLGAAGGAAAQTTGEIDAAEAAERVRAGSAFVLDVRRSGEFAEGHVEGAVNVAHTRLPERLKDLPRGRPMLVNCRSGARSARACAYLQRRGYDVTNVAGGYLAWEPALGAVRAGCANNRA